MPKCVIRKNCFETNSSSQHVICVTENDIHITPEEFNNEDEYSDEYIYLWKNDGSWHIHDIDDGYGRYPLEFLTTFKDKFKYAMCEYLGCMYGDEDAFYSTYNMFIDLAKEIVPGLKLIKISTKEIDIYKDLQGNDLYHNELIYDGWDSEKEQCIYSYKDSDGVIHRATLDEENILEVPNIGMIDHQSMGLLKNFLRSRDITLKEFLTNKRYIIVIDGDEYDSFNKLCRSGLIDHDFITEIYTTSNDDIEYQMWLKEQQNEEGNS